MNCKANKCPLPVEFVTNWEQQPGSTSVKPKWGVCRFHRQAVPEDWTITTQRILEYENECLAFINIHKIKNPILMPQPEETASGYLNRGESTLNKLILGDVDPADAYANFKRIIELLSN